MRKTFAVAVFAMSLMACGGQKSDDNAEVVQDSLELYRPAYHFSPDSGWMNDPNGLVYLDGEYHLFFQHNPDSTVWGPMHWGHAISKDLIHWEEQKIALYPDSLGTIFSGSAVVDKSNTAGFGENAMVAIFTHHNQAIEHEKTGLHQYQSIAYSTDKGRSWTKYEGNPVLPNPGIWDFRDPKVFWHEGSSQWVMVLATKQTISFYTSPNLKEWSHSGEFGEGVGAHGGVWECPDLLKFSTSEGDKWVLIVSLNPGGPNTGSATQYFGGDFDGKAFTSTQTDTRWMDYGPDDYAGVTFSNVGERHILVGWMSNWEYANVVPASKWRSAMTIARELSLSKVADKWILASEPVKELQSVTSPINLDTETLKTDSIKVGSQFRLAFSADQRADFEFTLANAQGDKLLFGYNKGKNEYYIDRSKAGHVAFSERYVQRAVAPRASKEDNLEFTVLVDRSSIELFADHGTTNLTSLFFVDQTLTRLHLKTAVGIKNLKVEKIPQTVGKR